MTSAEHTESIKRAPRREGAPKPILYVSHMASETLKKSCVIAWHPRSPVEHTQRVTVCLRRPVPSPTRRHTIMSYRLSRLIEGEDL